MADFTTTKLNAESHLILDQSLLRLPHELVRKNLQTARATTDKTQSTLLKSLQESTKAAYANNDASAATTSLDGMITRLQTLKRKLSSLHDGDMKLHNQTRERLAHLQELYDIPSLIDVKYDDWSRVRLDRLVVDYLLRMGYYDSARMLAHEKDIESLCDVEAFEQAGRIEKSLREDQNTALALAWCGENRPALKKIESNLEFELRLQQFIELVRSGQGGDTVKLREAIVHARKYLVPYQDGNFSIKAAGLLAFAPDTDIESYKDMYSPSRWNHLSALFLKTYHTLFALPTHPLLHIALSAGLSALKTPSCHSAYASSSANAASSSTSVCPICSTELNELARSVPYAHHSKSHVDSDPVVLPNGRIYGRERLRLVNEKLGSREGEVRDPGDVGCVFGEGDVKKVFIL